MNREEILRKSQQEKNDEGREYIDSRGRKYGVAGMLAIFMFLVLYYRYTGEQEQIYPLLGIIFGYLAAESLGIYQITKKKRDLAKICVGSLLCLAFLFLSLS